MIEETLNSKEVHAYKQIVQFSYQKIAVFVFFAIYSKLFKNIMAIM